MSAVRELFLQRRNQVDAEFIKAENGKKALEVLKSKTPHLIVLDIVMPVMNGFELLEQIMQFFIRFGPCPAIQGVVMDLPVLLGYTVEIQVVQV